MVNLKICFSSGTACKWSSCFCEPDWVNWIIGKFMRASAQKIKVTNRKQVINSLSSLCNGSTQCFPPSRLYHVWLISVASIYISYRYRVGITAISQAHQSGLEKAPRRAQIWSKSFHTKTCLDFVILSLFLSWFSLSLSMPQVETQCLYYFVYD